MIFKRKTFKLYIKYELTSDSIAFSCSGFLEHDEEIATLFNDFLLELSKERNIFFAGYYLSYEDAVEIIDPA